MAKPKRRWFRFSLRTLFLVITALCLWLGYSVHWITERHRVLEMPDVMVVRVAHDYPPPAAPWPLTVFREPGYAGLGVEVPQQKLSPSEKAKVRRIERLFPEAFVWANGWTNEGD